MISREDHCWPSFRALPTCKPESHKHHCSWLTNCRIFHHPHYPKSEPVWDNPPPSGSSLLQNSICMSIHSGLQLPLSWPTDPQLQCSPARFPHLDRAQFVLPLVRSWDINSCWAWWAIDMEGYCTLFLSADENRELVVSCLGKP